MTLTDLIDQRLAAATKLAELDALIARAQHVPLAPVEDRLMEVSEAAKRLGLKVSYLYTLGREQKLPVIKIGKFIKIRESVIRAIETGKIRL
jgi:excisionase family DNA binding protein